MNNISITNTNNSIINNITQKNIINNNENVLNAKSGFSFKTHVSKIHKSQIGYVENNQYIRSDNRTFNNTNNLYKHINQYPTDVFNNYNMNKTKCK